MLHSCRQETARSSTTFGTSSPLAVPRFIHYLLRTRLYISEYERRGKWMPPSQFDITWENFRSIPLILPPLDTQRAIADYLDRETSRIDALVAKKARMVELLLNRGTQSTVASILGGSALDGPLRQSRTFGVVPASWPETSLRHVGCQVQTGPFGSQLHAEAYVEGGWPLVNPTNITSAGLVADFKVTVDDETRQRLSRHILRAGDIVFGRRGEMGRAALVTASQDGWVCGTGSLRLRLRGPLRPEYLKVLLETPPARAYFELSSVGSTIDNLNTEIVLALPVLVPSLDEQARIVQEVQACLGLIKTTVVNIDSQLSLLREHRQALVTAAVTGELDVPGVAA